MANTSRAVKGFPDNWGLHSVPIVEHLGPASYVQGGELIKAPLFGVRAYAHITGGLTYSGTYRVECLYPGTGIRSSVNLFWSVVSTGQQVTNGTNLSGEMVRLKVVGG